jgi:hypothetical protein
MESATRISQNNTGQEGLQAWTSANPTVKQRLEESKDENSSDRYQRKEKEQMTGGKPQ